MQELSTRTHLSPASTWRRLKQLHERRVIERTVTILDPDLAGMPVCAYACVSLVTHESTAASKFEESMYQRPEVLECHKISGDADYVLKIRVPSVSAYERFIQEEVHSNNSVLTVKSLIALRTVKYTTALHIL